MSDGWTQIATPTADRQRWQRGESLVLVAWERSDQPTASTSKTDEATSRSATVVREGAAVRRLLQRLLVEEFGLDTASTELGASTHGRPWLPFAKDLDVSLAHAGGWVVCAIGRGARVGVDVEPRRAMSDLEGVADRVFGAGSCRILLDGTPPNDQQKLDMMAFFDRWTLAEAIAKLEGSGLELMTPGLQVERHHDPPRLLAWPANANAPCSAEHVALRRLPIDAACAAALAMTPQPAAADRPTTEAPARERRPETVMRPQPSSAQPDHATIRAIVDVARQAPSGDNSQPFVYSWDGTTLHVELDGARADHPLDHGGHPSLLTLGMIRAALQQGARAMGWQPRFTLGATERRSGSWLRVAFARSAPNTPGPDALLDTMVARHTDRRAYRGGDVFAAPLRGLDAAIDAEAARESVAIGVAPASHAGLRAWLHAGDRALWQAPAITEGAMRWVRFHEAELRREGDGVHWRNLGLPAPAAAGVALARMLPLSLRAAALMGGPQLTGAMLQRQLNSAAALVVIASRDPSRQALVDAGAVAMRVWSQLCAEGWGCQPMSLSPLLALAARDGSIDPAIPAHLTVAAVQAWPTIAASVGLPPGTWPAFVLRTGVATALPESERPPRRSVDALLRYA